MEFKYKLIVWLSSLATIFLGKMDVPLQTLIIFMVLDYVTGFIVAWIFKNSLKSPDGKLNSNVGFKGIVKKGMMLGIVVVAYRLDLLAGTNMVRNTIITAFIANEVVSINENATLMGINIPKYLQDIIKNMKM